MEYFRVKKEYDNYSRSDGSVLVKNELYTRKEVERYKIPKKYLIIVNVRKRDVYWFFGARFSNDCHYSS